MKKLFGLVLLLFYLVPNIKAQIDTEFWFAAPDLAASHAEQPVRFCITSFDSPATVVFEQPANASYTPVTFNLNANSFEVYDVSGILYMLETQPYNTVLNFGFHIYSTASVSVYYESDNYNSEIYSLKGRNALGTNFIVPSQYTYFNAYSTHSRTEVVATQDATEVTFLPSVPVKDGQPAGVPITITLNRGQCYALEAQGPEGLDHIRNTRITSNKPIAVNISDDSVDYDYSAQDLVGDQIVPVNLLGTDYLALWNNTSNEYLYFFPTQDNTKIYLNGSQTPVATLNVGQEYSYQINTSVVFVHSDKPIAAFQLASDEIGELGGTVLPHINCTGSRKVVYRRNGLMDIIITLVVKTSCVNDFLLNGNASWLTSADFSVVPANSEYSYCRKDVTQYVSNEGLITIQNTNEDGYFQMGVLSKGGASGTCSYGYFSDYHEYAYAEFSMNNSDHSFCVGDNITFNYISENVDNLTLILPNGTTMTQQPFVLTNVQISQSGTYQLQGESCNGIQILDEISINVEECYSPEIPLPDNIDSANCVFFPTATEWSISSPIISNVGNAAIVSTPMVGDVDGDGQQEIVIPSAYSALASQLNIYNSDGTLKSQFDIAGTYIWGTIGLAKVKWQGSTYKTIIVVFGANKYLYAYDANGTQLWQSNQPFSSHNGEDYLMPAISFADFNHDGWSEVFIGSEIFDAATGILLCKADGNKGCANRTWSWSNTPYQTMAADLCGDSRLELAIGNTVYNVNIQSRTDFSANQITVARQLPSSAMTMEDGSPIPFTDGNTFLADINLDGSLDVIVMNVDENSRVIYLYVWDVATSSIICSKKITNARKFGAPQIGDLDNNDYPEICFITGTYSDHNTGDNDKIYALKYNPSNSNNAMDVFWSIPHEDNSASTGLTMFDFNQDGYVELVYRDCYNLRIINGSLYNHQTGQPVSQPYDLAYISCCSATGVEYPVIADVDLDGEVEIVVGGETYGTDYGHVYIFKSEVIPWAPARPVWNQYMYNVTNVNKDLTIPQQLFNNATPFTDPDGMVRRPFNNFLQQATTIDQYGRPFYAVPDVAALSTDIILSGDNTTLNVTYTNQGDNTLNAPYYITVFANEFGGAMMQSLTVDAPLAVGNTVQQSLVFSTHDLCQIPDLSSLVVVINCAGGGIAQNGNLQPECDIENNMAQITVNLQTEPTCISETACDQFDWNGSIYTQSGEYQQSFTNSFGCDSLVILNLTISDSQTIELPSVMECDTYTWHGQTYAESGTYTYDTVNQYGCQTQYVLPLTISHSVEHEFSVTSCEPYEWYGTVYDEPGVYTQVLTGSQGCDSIVTLNLMVALSSESSIHGPTTIYASTDLVPGVYSYYIDSTGIDLSNVRWGIDREDWQLIPHGATCDLLCMSGGQGILHVWTEGESCNMDTTMVLNAAFFGMGEGEASLRVYPNPTKGKLTVEWEEIQVINVYDLLGQKLMSCEYGKAQSCVLDLSHFRHSMYVLEIVSSTGRVIRPVVLTQ